MITPPDKITETTHIIFINKIDTRIITHSMSRPFYFSQLLPVNNYISNIIYYVASNQHKNLSLFEAKKNKSGILSGGTYINNVDTIFESGVDLYQNGYKIDTSITIDGKFDFKYLNPSYTYDVKATPLNTDFNPRIVPNLKPVIDNSSFKFLFYCHYDKIYKSGKPYTIRTVAHDTRGILKFNMDGAPIGMSIDENTGVISFNLSTIGTYNFTVNCSDSLLELTKSIPMEIEIIA